MDNNVVKHGFYILDEFGNRTEVNKDVSVDATEVTPHIEYLIYDFLMFLEISGFDKETIKDAMDTLLVTEE